MCGWRDRFAVALAIGAIALLHWAVFRSVENSLSGMFLYHGSAAIMDFSTVIISAHVLSGRLSSDMQRLCLLSMIANYMGWLAYLAYLPPISYNVAILTLNCAQLARLLLIGRYDAHHLGRDLVRWNDTGGYKFHTEAGK